MSTKTVFALILVLFACGVIPAIAEAQAPSASSAPQQNLSVDPIELIVIAAIVAAALVSVGITLYKRAELHSLEKKTAVLKAKTEELRAHQRQQSMPAQSINVCKYCRAAINAGSAFCPVCRRAVR